MEAYNLSVKDPSFWGAIVIILRWVLELAFTTLALFGAVRLMQRCRKINSVSEEEATQMLRHLTKES